MSILAIETSSERLGVALVDEQRVRASYEVLAGRTHAIELPKAVQRVLAAGEETLASLTGIAVSIGPGSFTGLRIGLAFVKALAFRFRMSIIGVPSLDVLASNALWSPRLVCPVVDAKQRKVYAAWYRTAEGKLEKRSDYQLVSVEALCAALPSEPVLFLGDGIGVYRQQLEAALGDRGACAPPELWWPHAATVGRLGLERLRDGLQDDPATLVPMYLYGHDCTIRRPAVPTPASPS